MLPFKHNDMAIRTFHSMLTAHLADSLSHIPGLVAWSAIMANWHPVCTVRNTPALDAWHTFLSNWHPILYQWQRIVTRLIPPRPLASLLFAISRAITGQTLQPPKIVNPELLHYTLVAQKKAKRRSIRSADAKTAFMCMLQRLEPRDLKLIYTNGSRKWLAHRATLVGLGSLLKTSLTRHSTTPPC